MTSIGSVKETAFQNRAKWMPEGKVWDKSGSSPSGVVQRADWMVPASTREGKREKIGRRRKRGKRLDATKGERIFTRLVWSLVPCLQLSCKHIQEQEEKLEKNGSEEGKIAL